MKAVFNVYSALISKGKTTGIDAKIEIAYSNNRLTDDEYTALCGMLPAEEAPNPAESEEAT